MLNFRHDMDNYTFEITKAVVINTRSAQDWACQYPVMKGRVLHGDSPFSEKADDG